MTWATCMSASATKVFKKKKKTFIFENPLFMPFDFDGSYTYQTVKDILNNNKIKIFKKHS